MNQKQLRKLEVLLTAYQKEHWHDLATNDFSTFPSVEIQKRFLLEAANNIFTDLKLRLSTD